MMFNWLNLDQAWFKNTRSVALCLGKKGEHKLPSTKLTNNMNQQRFICRFS